MPNFHDLDILARTVYGEARGEPYDGQVAVANVIINRFRSGKWFASSTISGTCLKPAQFSCWNTDDPNRAVIMNAASSTLAPFYDICIDVLWPGSVRNDPSRGATHYQRIGAGAPWAVGKTPVVTIGNHEFFKGID